MDPSGRIDFPRELLDPGEKLLWSGRPRQGLRLQAFDILLIPFSLMWGGFAIFWEAAALSIPRHSGHSENAMVAWIFPLWGIPFVLVGLYMIFGRFFFDAASRKKTIYAVTDRRLVIVKSLFSRRITSYDHNTLINLSVTERSGGFGDIVFGVPGAMAYSGAFPMNSNRNRVPIPGFYLLPEARTVYNLIRQAQQQARK